MIMTLTLKNLTRRHQGAKECTALANSALSFVPPRLRERYFRRISMKGELLAIFFGLIFVTGLFAQQEPEDWAELRGDFAIAERYLVWAEDAIAMGQWPRAQAALERAADYSGALSDISYLLALARSSSNQSRASVMQALDAAFAADRWIRYAEVEARLLEADQLIAMRRYSAALDSLAIVKAAAADNADSALLYLAAFKGLNSAAEFHQCMFETLNRYPRDTRPLRLFFDYAHRQRSLGRNPDDDDITLMELILGRLPFLLDSDPELAWMAAPFISDIDETRRILSAYRSGSFRSRSNAGFRPNPASIVPALNIGLLNDTEAVDELFDSTGELVLDKELIDNVYKLLRGEEGREQLARRLLAFTGIITEDEDLDGYPETRCVYRQGELEEYYFDPNQDGLDEMVILFNSGSPQWAEIEPQVLILWERYPSVQRTVLGKEIYLPAPGAFRFAPLDFIELCPSETTAGLLYPRREPLALSINRRMLASFAATVLRPSEEFEGGVERVYLQNGVPVRAEVVLNGMTVSQTEYENGRPVIKRLDLDMNGVMETILRYEKTPGSEWD